MNKILKSVLTVATAGACLFSGLSCSQNAASGESGNSSGPKVFPTEPSIPCPEGEGIEVVFKAGTKMSEGAISGSTSYDNGEVTYVTSAANSGGGLVFFINEDQSIINLPNYDSIYVDFEYEAKQWASAAKKPQWCLNIYEEDAGFYEAKTLDYFGDGKDYGRTSYIYKLKESDTNTIVGIGIKLNTYQTENANSDTCRVTIKKIKFLRKEGAGLDVEAPDGLTDEQRGSLISVKYDSYDYANDSTKTVSKPANIYLPAGWTKEKQYPVLYLMHGIGGNEKEWGFTTNKSKKKKLMDKLIAEGLVEPMIIVCPVGRSTTNYTDGSMNNAASFYVFGSELKNDLIPYMEKEYNVLKGRENRAMAGLSMGGMQTINIGLCECLPEISWFGAFSAAPTTYEKAKIVEKLAADDLKDYNINYFYNICGLQDDTALSSHTKAVEGLDKECDKLTDGENFTWYTTNGVHGFDIWDVGLENFIKIAFKKKN